MSSVPRDPHGKIIEWFGAARDISERKRHEETQQLLVSELNHRVKNTLAVVQAIAQQTLRRAKDPSEFAASFGGRIQSMSRMHGLLSESGWQGAELREIIRGQLLAASEPSRVAAWGPPVHLDPQVALHVALMLHELGTNSVKHGALSRADGSVNLNWSVSDGKLHLQWAERGGPPVKAPLKRGFGTTLIEQTVKGEGGNSHMLIEAEGLRWEITLPIQSYKVVTAMGVPTARSLQSVSSRRPTPVQAAPSPLKGKRVLVVEDEPLIALDIVAGLESAGVEVTGPIGTVDEALRIIDGASFDAVLLDANLRGRPASDIAAALARRNIPFVFVTGYGREALPESFGQSSMLTKPSSQEQLVEAATQLIQLPAMTIRLRE